MTRTQFYSPVGRPISAEEFLSAMFGSLPDFFKNEDELRTIWSKPDTRKKLLEELTACGYTRDHLLDLQNMIDADKCDLYEVLAYVAFHSKPVERLTRANRARIHLDSYNPQQQAFLDFVLNQYIKDGVDELDDNRLPKLLELKYRAVSDAKRELGDIATIRSTFIKFQSHLYDRVAV